jgi:ketosteroid isomerase-like protein
MHLAVQPDTPTAMRHALVLALVVIIAACPHAKPAEPVGPVHEATPKEVVAATRGAIEQWRQAYEVRSMDALGKLYAHDTDVVIVQDGVALIGWGSVEGLLRDRLSRAKEIHIRLKEVQVTSVGSNGAFAVATMTREVGDGVTTVTENGALTLVFRKEATGWLIVGEHYSYKRPG